MRIMLMVYLTFWPVMFIILPWSEEYSIEMGLMAAVSIIVLLLGIRTGILKQSKEW